MAKKVKKAVKKTAPSRGVTKHHHWHPHDFLLVVAGGFIVIVLIILTSDSFKTQFFPVRENVAEEEIVEVSMNEQSVVIEEFSYSPDPITVKVGTTVTWTNNDADTHSATADDGTFDTGALEQGESGNFTFTEAGEYPYHCSYHPNMTGTIIVEE